jgi:hypothetical protein
MASLITPSWNQVVGFLTDWERLRRLANAKLPPVLVENAT